MEPKKNAKLKQLESLMKQAGMPTGAEAFKSDVFKKVAGIAQTPSKSKSAGIPHKPASKSGSPKIRTTSASTAQSYSAGSSFKNEYIVKEYKELLASLKKKAFSIKSEMEELHKKNEELLKDKQIKDLLEILEKEENNNSTKDIIQKLYNHISFVDTKINSFILSLQEEQTTENEDQYYSTAILIIEDSITHRKLLKSYFESFNFKNIVEAGTIKDALRLLDKYAKDPALPKIKLITVDQNLPGGTGLDFLRIFRNKSFYERLQAYKDTPVIMISGNINRNLIIEGAKFKINDYIKKPVDKNLLKEKTLKWIK